MKLSFTLIVFNLKTLKLFEKNKVIGHIIIMVQKIIDELFKFMVTFGAILLVFYFVLRMLERELVKSNETMFDAFLHIFNSLNSNTREDNFIEPHGSIFQSVLTVLCQILLVSFLITMFILRFFQVFKNIESIRRLDVIQVKNRQGYHPKFGAITISFFPLNVILLLYYPIALIMASERIDDFFVKAQYFSLVIIYCLLGLISSVVLFPIFYFKMVANSVYILWT